MLDLNDSATSIPEMVRKRNVVDNINRKRVKLRVYMLIEEQEVYREFAVQIMFVSPSFTLDGSC